MNEKEKEKKNALSEEELQKVSGGGKGSSKGYTESSNTPTTYYG